MVLFERNNKFYLGLCKTTSFCFGKNWFIVEDARKCFLYNLQALFLSVHRD